MSSTTVRITVEAQLQTSSPWPFIYLENVTPKPPVDSSGRLIPFISVDYVGSEQPRGIGDPDNRCWREIGTIMVLIFLPSNTGMSRYLSDLEALRRAFRGKSWAVAPPGISLEIEGVDPVADFATTRWKHSIGDYRIKSMAMGYRFDYH